jgi:circadian clock protein KaiC
LGAIADVPVLTGGIEKAPTGIDGFDEITGGGLPRGRTSLVCGGAGCGKTLFGMEFLVRGATEFGEPGIFVAFEETTNDLKANVRSLGFDLENLIERDLVRLDHIILERDEIAETGEYDLEGLFIRLNYAIDSIGAKRVVIDTIETLFAGLSNPALLRSELRRLFSWFKQKGVTAIVTGERGDGQLTRQGLEEYVSDCVVLLDHRVNGQISTRRLRVVKYRGSHHGTNEYPFLIGADGISVLPITSMGLGHSVTTERVPSGIPELDEMLGGAGFYRGSSVLISGTSGTGKSSMGAHFVDATCRRGERAIYFAFEESPDQMIRNMRSIGIDLQQWVDKGLLTIVSTRPSHYGLEMHLAMMIKAIHDAKPTAVVVDPISNLVGAGELDEVEAMLVRLVDTLKADGVTGIFNSLTQGGSAMEKTDVGLSSLMDTWLLLRDIESDGERNRGIYVLKSRGMKHSNQIREFVLTDHGIRLLQVYLGPHGVVTGSARISQEAAERAEQEALAHELERRRMLLQRKHAALQAQIASLQAELEAEQIETSLLEEQYRTRLMQADAQREAMASSRGVVAASNGKGERGA